MKHNFDFNQDFRMLSAATIHNYIHAGKGEVTLASPSGIAHSYLFSMPRNASDFPEGTIFVYALHNDKKFYIGMLTELNEFRLTARSYFNADTEVVRGAAYIAKMATCQDLVDTTSMQLYHSGKCCRCGRKLTSAKALECGMGRLCRFRFNTISPGETWDGNS